MAQKRRASATGTPTPKRVQKQTALDDSDPIYDERHSDAEYSVSGTPSVASDDLKETPATPFSSTSARYPSELKTHGCPFDGCTKAFNRPARLQEHLRSHNNDRIFQCTHENCDKSFLRASHLHHHIKSAHTGIRDYVCDRPGCGKSFVTGSRLRRHLAAHDGRDKYRCTEHPPCNETFRKHSTLQKHITTVHLKQKPFPCPHVDDVIGQKCPMAFDTAGHLRAHESRVHTEKRFSCAECSQNLEQQQQQPETNSTDSISDTSVTFPTYALLQAHIRTAHPPKCPNCPIVCSTSRELRRHLEVAHGDVSVEERKVYACTVPGCGRSFTKKGNLTVHIRTVHEGEKRFACGETDLSSSKRVTGWDGIGCGKRYGSKLALEEHIRTAHLGYQNAKAERRLRLGQNTRTQSNKTQISTLAALTGQGYVEETGRHISCFYDSCEHRFHRDYDLWLHMSAKHGCSEDEIQGFFMQRALLADGSGPGVSLLGIYGLEFDHDDQPFSHEAYTEAGLSSDMPGSLGREFDGVSAIPDKKTDEDSDFVMQDDFVAGESRALDSMMTNHDEMALIDPVLTYHLME